MAVVSFLAARAAPTGGFWVALAGGVAVARVAERRGARLGFGASIAAMLETVAIIGPARFGVPLTQAATAPIIGRLHARRSPLALQLLVVAALRLLHNTATTAFFIWVIAGGLDAYAGTYDAIGRRLGLDVGTADALALTAAGLVAWCAFATVVQVLVYRRGLHGWDGLAADDVLPHDLPGEGDAPPHRGRFDPRLVSLAAAMAFGVLLASTAWPVLLGVALFLAIAWPLSRPDSSVLPTGLAFCAALGGGALLFGLGGGIGLDEALRRAARAALLVLVATWMRAAAGAEGLRDVGRRILVKLRRVPSMPEAAEVLDSLGSERRLVAGARALAGSLRDVPYRPLPFLDAVLAWVVAESERPEGTPPARDRNKGPHGPPISISPR
ncbi:MAG: hypothetical protein JW895_14885 [Thermoleophilaceae bacterium]|nr:hypothetical protein [Thermoleophilaceae bacterium]